MNVRQNLSVLFYLRGTKETKEREIPIYIRITVDGLKVELSLGHKVQEKDWEFKSKLVKSSNPKWKLINRKITQAKTDIERHFDLCTAKNGLATAEMVKSSYMSPASGAKSKKEKIANLELSEAIDDIISKYFTCGLGAAIGVNNMFVGYIIIISHDTFGLHLVIYKPLKFSLCEAIT